MSADLNTQDPAPRTQDSTQHSGLSTQDSALRTQHSGLSTRHSTHARGVEWLDLENDPDLARLSKRILILPQVLLRHFIYVFIGSLFGYLGHPPSDFEVAIRVVGIEYRDGHRRIRLHVLILATAASRVYQHVCAVVVDPHWCYLRSPVRIYRGQICECLL